jgi:methyl-accepting chemotaxis protein
MVTQESGTLDLRTKLILALVATSLVSTLLLGLFSYQASERMLRTLTARQLDALVDTRAEDFALIGQAWLEEVRLIRSRTELRRQLARYPEAPQAVRTITKRILEDAVASVDVVRRVTVFTPEGTPVAQAGVADFPASPTSSRESQKLSFSRYERAADGSIEAVLHTPVNFDRRLVGHMEAVVDISGILELTRSYRGLGETGETLLVAELEPGTLTLLNQTRHGVTPPVDLAISEATPAMRAALSGYTAVLEDVPDYRGVVVWAATRKLQDVDTGLLVKIDAEEELAPLVELRDRMTDVALSVGALAILAGALLGFYLARPIKNLDSVVHRIREGDTQLRADTSGEDEISFLAESFNELMDRVSFSQPHVNDDGEHDS